MQTLVVEPLRRVYQIGPLTVSPGSHQLVFHPAEGPTVASDAIGGADARPLSFAIGTWSWTVPGEDRLMSASAYRDFWAGVGERFPDLDGAASTRYYADNERRLFTEHFPVPRGTEDSEDRLVG